MKKVLCIFVILSLILVLSIPTFAGEPGQAESSIPFRFATREEGVELMLANVEYFEKFSPNKLGYVMQNKDTSIENYIAFAREQVLDWTNEEKDAVAHGMKLIEDTFANRGWVLPPLETIVFIKTTMAEENYVMGYTHGTQVYLGNFLDSYFSGNYTASKPLPDGFCTLLAHELFHCLTRCNPDFRAQMYSLIHFTIAQNDYALPPSVWEYYIANPDVEHHNSWATFTVDGKEIDCFTAFVTTKHFENKGEHFFKYGTTVLVPVDGSDVYYSKDQASNFDAVFGTNTGYVIDPEECMADNFSYAVIYGLNGLSGEGYDNPEIIEGIFEILSRQ